MASPLTSPAPSETPGGDKAGSTYWDHLWEEASLPPPLDPRRRGLKNYPYREFHGFFQKTFAGWPTEGRKLMEVGCAQSVFLPYFAREFGFQVAGLDRSGVGCERARMILEREKVSGPIHRADFFSPPDALLGQFDYLLSYGVVEHFEDTAGAIRALARLLKPQGRMVTLIPNLAGLLGSLQKRLGRAIYDIHVVLDQQGLADAHARAGLAVESCEYFMTLSLEVLNFSDWRWRWARRVLERACTATSRVVWLMEGRLPGLRPNRWSSPYVICVARRPEF
jgi:2-polyprenyl-3-methyl-5-hydroxy-6-metoxy-1,4-benzoquinol methylase